MLSRLVCILVCLYARLSHRAPQLLLPGHFVLQANSFTVWKLVRSLNIITVTQVILTEMQTRSIKLVLIFCVRPALHRNARSRQLTNSGGTGIGHPRLTDVRFSLLIA